MPLIFFCTNCGPEYKGKYVPCVNLNNRKKKKARENTSPLAVAIKRVVQFRAKPGKAFESKYVMNDSHSCGRGIMRSSLENMFLHKIQSF